MKFLQSDFNQFVMDMLDLMGALFVFGVGVLIIVLFVLYIIDETQNKHTLRKNYPLIGRSRYMLEHLGEFLRQYLFAFDREELPFNRSQRTWAYRAAKNLDNNVAFGSNKNSYQAGGIIFANSAFPVMSDEAETDDRLLIGPGTQKPYQAASFFNISAMSFGALSSPAITALAEGAKQAGCWLNTGEGGVSKMHLEAGCDLVFQIGTALYGVRDEKGLLCPVKLKALAEHEQIKMFEIKLSQGAKPGKGGILPAEKVTSLIAATRGIPEGKASLSPGRHHGVNNDQDLIDYINRIRDITGKPCGIKLVLGSENWLKQFCQTILDLGIEKAPDFITIDGAEGGTGAAPMPLIDDVGLSIKESLPLLINTLNHYGLKDRIKVIASGKLTTPNQVAWAISVGADVCTSARGFMFSLGCIQSLKCNKNTCPTGIATHDPKLLTGFNIENKTQRVAYYHQHMLKEVSLLAHVCGCAKVRELNRDSARIVLSDGKTQSLNDYYKVS